MHDHAHLAYLASNLPVRVLAQDVHIVSRGIKDAERSLHDGWLQDGLTQGPAKIVGRQFDSARGSAADRRGRGLAASCRFSVCTRKGLDPQTTRGGSEDPPLEEAASVSELDQTPGGFGKR